MKCSLPSIPHRKTKEFRLYAARVMADDGDLLCCERGESDDPRPIARDACEFAWDTDNYYLRSECVEVQNTVPLPDDLRAGDLLVLNNGENVVVRKYAHGYVLSSAMKDMFHDSWRMNGDNVSDPHKLWVVDIVRKVATKRWYAYEEGMKFVCKHAFFLVKYKTKDDSDESRPEPTSARMQVHDWNIDVVVDNNYTPVINQHNFNMFLYSTDGGDTWLEFGVDE